MSSDKPDEIKSSHVHYPVRVKRMRMSYRDILTASGAGEELYHNLANTVPVWLVEHFTLAWTGSADCPIALKREGWHPGPRCELSPKPVGRWYYFAAGSLMERIVNKESRAYYPDATRNYSYLDIQPCRAYILVVGNLLVRIWFDQEDELARLPQQHNSLLDMIARSLLDFRQRELRHLQDQMAMLQIPEIKDSQNPRAQDDETLALMHAHGRILESFFGFLEIQIRVARDLATVLFPTTASLHPWDKPDEMISLMVAFNDYQAPIQDDSPLEILTFPMYWGSHNEEGLFELTLSSRHAVNPHVRRELLLNQALFRIKQALEALFETRYRELRMAQDYAHFQRCKAVRSQSASFQDIKDHLIDSIPEYGRMKRGMDRSRIFPAFAEWHEGLRKIFVDTDEDFLEFRQEIRLKNLNAWEYLDIRTPDALMDLLREGLRSAICFTFDSQHPVLARFSDPLPENTQDTGETASGAKGIDKVLCFNNAATISIHLPGTINFHFERMQKMANEYLESAGEGISRLFQSISLQSGIPNRQALIQTLSFFINQVQYADLVELEVSSMDIVRFKIFNELFGHPFGDKVIRYVAHQIVDRVPGSGFHVSGDEFYLVQCYTTRQIDEWVERFFTSKGIIMKEVYDQRAKKIEEFAKGIAIPLIFEHCKDQFSSSPLGTYNLADFISNFFTMNSQGVVSLKEYSRTGRDYWRVIHDPDRKIQALVDKAWEALSAGNVELGSEAFRDFVYRNSNLDRYLYIIPRLTVGTVSYNSQTVLAYASDILEAADTAAGRNKK